ncbi:MAG: DUF4331 family protein [Longimicrobiales bacterium]
MRRFALYPLALAAAFVMAGCDEDVAGPDTTDMAAAQFAARAFDQTDRFGLPAINTVLIPSAKKDLFNTSPPANDRAQFFGDVVAALLAFGNDGAAAEGLARAVLPDVQPIDLTQPSGFLNGRRLQDDVITAELMLIFGGNAALNDDHVDANDRPLLSTFPYLAQPHTS